MPEGDVTINLPKLYRGIADRLKHKSETWDSYHEGWNDALYVVLDILDGQEPIAAPIDGPGASLGEPSVAVRVAPGDSGSGSPTDAHNDGNDRG